MNSSASPPAPTPAEDHGVVRHNARAGLTLFAFYLVIYASFVLLCVFKLDAMAQPLMGVNVDIWFGFGLIIGAFLLSIIYLILCQE